MFKGFLTGLLAVAVFAVSAHAEAPPEARLPAEPPVAWEKRLTDLEKRVAALEAPPAAKAAPKAGGTVVVPPGHHAHTRLDGTTVIHADHTGNDAAAHAGVAWPWYKSATAGQTVTNVVSAPAVAATAPGSVGRSFTATNGVTYVADPSRPGTFVPASQAAMFGAPTVSGMRQLTWQTPLLSGRVCIGPNCPQR